LTFHAGSTLGAMTGVKSTVLVTGTSSRSSAGTGALKRSTLKSRESGSDSNWILARYPVHNSSQRLVKETEKCTPIAEQTSASNKTLTAEAPPKAQLDRPRKVTRSNSFTNSFKNIMVTKAKKTTATNKATSDDELLYGLYKQATVGDAPKRSFTFSKKKKNKKKAWNQLQDIPEDKLEEALLHVSKALEILKVDGSSSSISFPLSKQVDESSASEGETAEDKSEDMAPEERLLAAAAENDTTTVRALLARGVNKNATDECGQTALHMAADNGAEEVVKVLLDNGASVNGADQHGVSVLQAAVIAGHVGICKILLDKGADPEQQDEDGDR